LQIEGKRAWRGMAAEITYKNIQVTGWLRIRMSSI
jgi:hypothetical protein